MVRPGSRRCYVEGVVNICQKVCAAKLNFSLIISGSENMKVRSQSAYDCYTHVVNCNSKSCTFQKCLTGGPSVQPIH